MQGLEISLVKIYCYCIHLCSSCFCHSWTREGSPACVEIRNQHPPPEPLLWLFLNIFAWIVHPTQDPDKSTTWRSWFLDPVPGKVLWRRLRIAWGVIGFVSSWADEHAASIDEGKISKRITEYYSDSNIVVQGCTGTVFGYQYFSRKNSLPRLHWKLNGISTKTHEIRHPELWVW